MLRRGVNQNRVLFVRSYSETVEGYTKAIIDAGNNMKKFEWKGDGINPNLQSCSLEGNHDWLTLESPTLIIRPEYEKMWDMINPQFLAHRENRRLSEYKSCLIKGNPGIGKTASANYLMIRALQDGQPVLFETRMDRYFFDPKKDDAVREDVALVGTELRRKRNDINVICFHDHLPDTEPPQIDAGSFVVAPVSPNLKNFHEFQKHDCMDLFMPLPTAEDIRVMRAILWDQYDDKEIKPGKYVSEEDVEKRLEIFGPIPRLIFRNFSRAKHQLKSKITGFDVEKASRTMLMDAIIPQDKSGLSWWILNVDSSDLEEPTSIDWASDHIRKRVLNEYAKSHLISLEKAIAKSLHNPLAVEVVTSMFEHWSIMSIAGGRKLEPTEMKVDKKEILESKSQVIQLEAHDVVRTIDHPSLQVLEEKKDTVFYSTKPNAKAYDASFLTSSNELVLIQSTIGKTHSIKIKAPDGGTNIVEEAVKAKMKVRFVFVVPSKRNFKVGVTLLEATEGIFPKTEQEKVSIEVAELSPKFYD